MRALQFTVDISGSTLLWMLAGGLIAIVAAVIMAGVTYFLGELGTLGWGGGSYSEDFKKGLPWFVPTGMLSAFITAALNLQWWMAVVMFVGAFILIALVAEVVHRIRFR